MSKNVIFCYSGTGNCLDMAKNIAKQLHDTDIIMMRKAPVRTDVSDAECVGFVVPCYAGGLPGDVESYLDTIKLAPGAYTFAVGQYSGYLGTGIYTIDKKIGLDYWAGVSHQCSCIWLLPHGMMMPPSSPAAAQKRSEKLAQKIAADVAARTETKKAPPKMSVCAVEHSVWPEMAAQKAAKFSVKLDCISCGQCERLCPRGNIRLVKGRPIFGTNCIQCLSCLQYCPKEAITLGTVTERREHYHNPNITPDELVRDIIHID